MSRVLNIVHVEETNRYSLKLDKFFSKKSFVQYKKSHTLKEAMLLVESERVDVLVIDMEALRTTTESMIEDINIHFPLLPIVAVGEFEEGLSPKKLLRMGVQEILLKKNITEESFLHSIELAIERRSLCVREERKLVKLENLTNSLNEEILEKSKKLSQKEMKYRSLVNMAPLSVLIVDKEFNVQFSNPEFSNAFGYCSQLPIENLSSLFPSDQLFKTIKMKHFKKSFKKKVQLRTCDGQPIWSHIFIAPITSAGWGSSEYLVIIHNISDSKQSEIIEEEKRLAEQANQAKTEFLTHVSHELRTPLTAIVGFVEMLQQKSTDPEWVRILASVRRNSQHILFLINDLLDLSKIEAGQLEVNDSRFSIVREVDVVAEMIRPLIHQRPIELKTEYVGLFPENIVADASKIRQILINLVNNSLKYTEEGKVKIRLKVDQRNGEDEGYVLKLNIEDTGVGISEEQIPNLFQPFMRGDNQKILKKEGMGIGLALSKKLANLMGGDLFLVSSEPEKGSNFQVELPVRVNRDEVFYWPQSLFKIQPKKEEKSLHLQGRFLEGKKILVAEDAEEIQMLLESVLEKFGAKVELCGNGKEAVDRLSESDFDLTIMDVQMPIMSGTDAVKLLRKQEYNGKILALTAHAFKSERDYCMQCGYNGFISKPFTEHQLLTALHAIFFNDSVIEKGELSKTSHEGVEKKLARVFFDNFEKNINEADKSLQENDLESFKRVVHRMKGSASCFNYSDLAGMCDNMESIAVSESPSLFKLKDMLTDLHIAKDRLVSPSSLRKMH